MGRKRKIPNIVFCCNRCGKIPPIDKKMSSENWIVYNTKEDCECGGKWEHRIVSDEEFAKYEEEINNIISNPH